MFKHCLLAALLAAIHSPLLAADAPAGFTDRGITYHAKNGNGKAFDLTLPWIEGADKASARRMNVQIHDLMLDTLPDEQPDPKKPRLVLLDASVDDMKSEGVRSMNGGRTLSAKIYAEGCGASCSGGSTVLDFDTRNGRSIVRQEVLTPGGQQALSRQMLAFAATRLNKEIAALQKQLASGKAGKVRNLDDLRAQLSMYEGCLEERFSRPSRDILDDLGVMNLGDGALSFSHAGCASHAEMALDEVGDLTMVLRAAQLRPHLSDYGRYLLLGEGKGETAPVNPYAQYFKGTINGTIPVTLYLGANGNRPLESAHYYYDRYKKKIELEVKRDGTRFELTERDNQDAVKAVLRLELKGDQLTGQWTGGGKTYPLAARAF